jgi:cysteine desulfurase
MKVYFDNAATTPIEPSVVQSITDALVSEYGNPSSIHSKGRSARTLVEDSRKIVAQILGASTGEIFFTSCATESNNMALICSVRDLGIERIISSPTEHPCVLNSIELIKTIHPGVTIEYVAVDHLGQVDFSDLESRLKNSTKKTLVSLMHGNNEIGTMINLEELSQLCLQYEALLHSDTVQTIGKTPIDLSKTTVNFISGSGHKIYGPKGIGIIYINNNNMTKAFIQGGGQERSLRSGTENVYGIAGFASAIKWLHENQKEHHETILSLRTYFKSQIATHIPEIQYFGNQNEYFLPHILSLSVPRTPKTEMIMFNLDINGICASSGSACSSGTERDSHVMEAIKAPLDRKAVRFSFSHNNTFEEIDYTIDKLKGIIN